MSPLWQVMQLYGGLQDKLETVIERATLVDQRVADEQAITARVATRALETIDGLVEKVHPPVTLCACH